MIYTLAAAAFAFTAPVSMTGASVMQRTTAPTMGAYENYYSKMMAGYNAVVRKDEPAPAAAAAPAADAPAADASAAAAMDFSEDAVLRASAELYRMSKPEAAKYLEAEKAALVAAGIAESEIAEAMAVVSK